MRHKIVASLICLNMKRRGVAIIAAALAIPLIFVGSGCQCSEHVGVGGGVEVKEGDVEIVDPYCTYEGSFHFTLKNLKSENIAVDYKWTLNDPKADKPAGGEGSGKATVKAREQKEIVVHATTASSEYDARFYVMYIYVYHKGDQVAYYRGQKSTYDWDYSTLPPTLREGKELHAYLDFDIFISKVGDDYMLEINNIFWVPPETSPRLSLDNIIIRIDDQPEFCASLEELKAGNSGASQYEMRFCDKDQNGKLSDGDYITTSMAAGGKWISFDSKEDPRLSIGAHDIVREEELNAIQILDVYHGEVNEDAIEIYAEITSKNPIAISHASLLCYTEGGASQLGCDLIQSEDKNSTTVYKFTLDPRYVKEGMDVRAFLVEFADDFGLRGNEAKKLYLIY